MPAASVPARDSYARAVSACAGRGRGGQGVIRTVACLYSHPPSLPHLPLPQSLEFCPQALRATRRLTHRSLVRSALRGEQPPEVRCLGSGLGQQSRCGARRCHLALGAGALEQLRIAISVALRAASCGGPGLPGLACRRLCSGQLQGCD